MRTLQHAVIAAAGFGSRLNKGIPKCLVNINGHKIIEYQLALLQDIPDVRVVVGYHANEVISFVKDIRPDVSFIVNEKFDTTSTLQSYYMGCHDIHDFFLLLDGDIIPHKTIFRQFLCDFSMQNVVGISRCNTEDAVFTHLNSKNEIIEFTRIKPSPYEWANIALLHSDCFTNDNIYVYQCIDRFLPLQGAVVERLEIDTPADMEYAISMMHKKPEEYIL